MPSDVKVFRFSYLFNDFSLTSSMTSCIFDSIWYALMFFDILWCSLYLNAGKASPRPGRSRQWELAINWWAPTEALVRTQAPHCDCLWRLWRLWHLLTASDDCKTEVSVPSVVFWCTLYFSKFLAPLLQLQGSHLCARAFRKKDVVPKLLLLAPDRFPALAHHRFKSTSGSGKWIPSLSHYTACTKPARWWLAGWKKYIVKSHHGICFRIHAWNCVCKERKLEPNHCVKLCTAM